MPTPTSSRASLQNEKKTTRRPCDAVVRDEDDEDDEDDDEDDEELGLPRPDGLDPQSSSLGETGSPSPSRSRSRSPSREWAGLSRRDSPPSVPARLPAFRRKAAPTPSALPLSLSAAARPPPPQALKPQENFPLARNKKKRKKLEI